MIYASKNSVCYGCPRRNSRCHARCPDYVAEAARRESDRQYRLIQKLGEYSHNYNKSIRKAIADRAGGRV